MLLIGIFLTESGQKCTIRFSEFSSSVGRNILKASRGEIKIHEILKHNDINFKEEYEFPSLKSLTGTPLRFDFAVFDDCGDLDFLIEFQGKQHYEPVSKFGGARGFFQQQYNDKRKRRFCTMNGIKLIEIPYWEENLINYDYIYKKAYE